MPTDIIQSGGSFGSWLANLGKKALTSVAIPLARDNCPGLVSNLASNVLNKFERKKSGKGAVREGKWFAFIYFKWRHKWYYQNNKPIRIFGFIN